MLGALLRPLPAIAAPAHTRHHRGGRRAIVADNDTARTLQSAPAKGNPLCSRSSSMPRPDRSRPNSPGVDPTVVSPAAIWRSVECDPGVHIEFEASVWIDVTPKERGERVQVARRE